MELTTIRFPDDTGSREDNHLDERLLRESEILEQLPALAGWLESIRTEGPIAS